MLNLSVITPWASRAGGGLQSSVRDLVLALARQDGIEVKTYSLNDKYSSEDILAWGNLNVNLSEYYGPESFRFSPGLLCEILKMKSDFTQLHGIWMMPSLALKLRKLIFANEPYMISPHGMMDPWIVNRNRWKKDTVRALWENSLWANASVFRALNTDEAESINKLLPKAKICIVPNGVGSLSDEEFQRIIFHRKNKSTRDIIFLGRLHEKKRVLELIDAWKIVAEQNAATNVRLHIAGWGDPIYTEMVKSKIRDLNLESIKFLGPMFGQNKHELLKNAAAFILPSVSEGLPVAVLEACAYGVVPIISRQCNLPNLLKLNLAFETGTTVNEIVQSLLHFLSTNVSSTVAQGDAARAYVAGNYNWDSIADDLINVQKWIVSGGVAPKCTFFS